MGFPSFTTGEVLTAADMNAVGLWLVGSTTFTASSKPFINGCFTSNYQNYAVKIAIHSSASCDVSFQMRSGTSTEETGAVYDRFGFQFNPGVGIQDLTLANQTSAFICAAGNTAASRSSGTIDLFSPNVANVQTVANVFIWDGLVGYSRLPSHRIETNTQYTGIQLIASAGATLTGSMRVYGYRD